MYAVSVSNSIGCKSVSDSIKIVVNPLPSAILVSDPSGTLNLCPGTTATITAPVASSYLWSNNAVTQNIVINKAGSYNVIITDANGCKATSQSKIVSYQSCVTPSGLNVQTLAANAVMLAWTSNACAARFKIEYRKVGTTAWLTAGTSNSNTFALTGLLSSTAYKWRVATLCDTKDTIYSLAEGSFTTTASSNLTRYVASPSSIIEDLAISLYPNPAKNAATLIIRGAIDQSTFVTLVNATGKVLWNNNRITSNTLALPVQQLTKGVYFIKVNTAQGIKVTKFIKE
jgi:hypothetical protein